MSVNPFFDRVVLPQSKGFAMYLMPTTRHGVLPRSKGIAMIVIPVTLLLCCVSAFDFAIDHVFVRLAQVCTT